MDGFIILNDLHGNEMIVNVEEVSTVLFTDGHTFINFKRKGYVRCKETVRQVATLLGRAHSIVEAPKKEVAN